MSPKSPWVPPTREEQALGFWIDHFHPYQRDWIKEEAFIALLVKARQIGFSYATAGKAVYDALKDGSTNIILSASQDLSAEVLSKARFHAGVLAEGGHLGARTVESNATRIVFKNGGRVIALPANPRTARSFTGNVHFDEAAYHADFKSIWDAAAAMATRGGFKIRIVSTPNGAQGMFYDWVAQPPSGWAMYRVDIEQARDAGMKVNLNQLWELAGHDERVFSQWYRCQFLDAQMQYIPTAFADRALRWRGPFPNITDVDLFAGLDVGRVNDLTVLTVLALVEDKVFTVAQMSCQRTHFKAQRRMIEEARQMFPWLKLHVDQTGIGRGMAEELVEEYGDEEVVPIDFTMQAKADLATRTLRWFRDDRVRFTRDEEGRKLRNETISIQRIVSPSGNVLYDAPQTAHGHADRFWSFALALVGAGEPPSPSGMGNAPLLAVA